MKASEGNTTPTGLRYMARDLEDVADYFETVEERARKTAGQATRVATRERFLGQAEAYREVAEILRAVEMESPPE